MYFASFLAFGKRSAHAFTSKTLSDDFGIWFKAPMRFLVFQVCVGVAPGNTVNEKLFHWLQLCSYVSFAKLSLRRLRIPLRRIRFMQLFCTR
jgi:hypothetical protein